MVPSSGWNWIAVNAQFNNPTSTNMKTKNVTTLHLRKSSDRSPLRLAFLLIPLLLACFALSPAVRAVSPAPDGGYPGGHTAEGAVSGDTAEGAVFLLAEGFNNVNNLPGWFRRNNSQPLGFTNWFQGDPDRFEAFAGPANSYIAADHFNGFGTATISNWFVTPVLPLQNGVTFDFVTRHPSHLEASPDRLQVRLSRNGASTNVGSTAFDVGDFTELLLDINPFYSFFAYPEEWTPLGVTLSGFGPPTTGRLAFRYFVEDGGPGGFNSWYIGIDNVIATGPAQITVAATNVASFSATLNGALNPYGLTTSVSFQYGTTTSYGLTTPVQTQTGNTVRNVSANINNLNASTVYHFRIVTTNSGGTHFGGDRTFTTLSATGAPVVTSNPGTFIASFSATLNGSLDPHGLTTTVHFRYGTTTSYGLTTAPQSQSGNTFRNITANISGLSPSTVYHFRARATNSAGTTFSSDRTFTTLSATGAPVVTTNPATNVTSSSTTLNGSLDPHGLTTNVYFQYGTTTGYGHATPMRSQTGNTFRNISANISGLSAHTTYHFRIVATNSGGTRFGGDRTFTTH